MALPDGMYAVGPHRVRGSRSPATIATVRWDSHPHIQHGAGSWTKGSTRTTPATTVSAGAGCRTGGGSRCWSAVWGTHQFFYPEHDAHVQPSALSGACSGAIGQQTGGDRPPTHHANNPPTSAALRYMHWFLFLACRLFPLAFLQDFALSCRDGNPPTCIRVGISDHLATERSFVCYT